MIRYVLPLAAVLALLAPLHPAPRPTAPLSGVASWYAAPEGTAAAGPALRAFLGRHWRGTTVVVAAHGRTTRVRIDDWCRCPGGRVVDLAASSFAALAPLSAGLVRVRISRPVPLPATDAR